MGGRVAVLSAQAERRAAATEHLALEYPADLAPWIESHLEPLDRRYRMLAGALDTELDIRPLIRIWPADQAGAGIDPSSHPLDGGLLVPRLQLRHRLDLLARSAPPDSSSPDLLTPLELDLILLLGVQLTAQASDGLCPASLSLGTARYLQPPGELQARLVTVVKTGLGRAPSLEELMEPGAEYQDPEVFQAWSLSLVHHLVQREGLGGLTDLLRAFPRAAGWRDALQTTYRDEPARLEADWHASLPAYVDGGWREHLFYGTDLAAAERSLREGDFRSAALLAKAAAASWDPRVLDQAEDALALGARAEAAQLARSELALGLSLLEDGHYAAAVAAGRKAADTLDAAEDNLGANLALELADRAERGERAMERWRQARGLGPWKALQAGLLARKAAADFQLLGHRLRAADADAWARGRLTPVAWLGTLCCAVSTAWLVRWWLKGSPAMGTEAR